MLREPVYNAAAPLSLLSIFSDLARATVDDGAVQDSVEHRQSADKVLWNVLHQVDCVTRTASDACLDGLCCCGRAVRHHVALHSTKAV